MNETPAGGQKASARPRAPRIPLDKIGFSLALAVIVFVGGMAAAHFNTLPYRLLNEAKAALNAQLKIEDDRFPSQIGEFLDPPSALPAMDLAPDAGDEPLLVPAGATFARMDVCPQFGCVAWVLDRRGRVLHAWPMPDPAVLFSDMHGFTGRIRPENFYVIGMAPDRDGSIVVTFHARNIFPYQVGIAKLDINGRLLWKKFDHSHHWPTVGPDGRIYTPSMRLGAPGDLSGRGVEIKCDLGKVYWEGVHVLSPDGAVLKNFDMAESLARSNWPGLAYSAPDGCDPFHVNGIDLADEAAVRKLNVSGGDLPHVNVGDLLVSVRESSALVVMDQETGEVKRAFVGRWAAQHSPHFMPDGDIVVFDNQGGERRLGGSRVLRFNPETRVATTVFPTMASRGQTPFFTATSGAIQPSPDGRRMLVTDNMHSALIEIETASGRPLWRFENIYDFKPFLVKYGYKVGKKTYVRPPQNGAFYVVPEAFTPEAYATLVSS